MEKQVYITEEERVKCQKVAGAFTELYEMADVVVVGRKIRFCNAKILYAAAWI